MTSPELLAEHEFPDGSTMTLRRLAHGPAAFDLATGLPGGAPEAGWPFDGVSIRRNDVVLTREHGRVPGESVASGRLDGPPSAYGAVGHALKLIERGETPRPQEVPADAE